MSPSSPILSPFASIFGWDAQVIKSNLGGAFMLLCDMRNLSFCTGRKRNKIFSFIIQTGRGQWCHQLMPVTMRFQFKRKHLNYIASEAQFFSFVKFWTCLCVLWNRFKVRFNDVMSIDLYAHSLFQYFSSDNIKVVALRLYIDLVNTFNTLAFPHWSVHFPIIIKCEF